MTFQLRDIDGREVVLQRFDPTSADIEDFCEAHDVDFHAMGTPKGVEDPHGSGWGDMTRFRVRTRTSMMGGSQRGATVPLDSVRAWKASIEILTQDDAKSFDDLMDSTRDIGRRHPDLEAHYLQQCLRNAHERLSPWGQKAFSRRVAEFPAVKSLPDDYAISTPLENAILAAHLEHDDLHTTFALHDMLRDCVKLLAPKARADYWASEHVASLHDLAAKARPAAGWGG